jgi:phosphinothricin acetyltransferase
VRAIYGRARDGRARWDRRASWDQWNAARRRIHARGARARHPRRLSPVVARVRRRAEVGLYVTASARGQGIGRALLEAIIESSGRHGIWTLQSATIAENEASLAVQRRCGFRVIGRRERIARRDGVWRDTILLERRSSTVGV